MIKYGSDADGDLVIEIDDETLMGTNVRLNMGDDKGLEMFLELASFYKNKGHNISRVLHNYIWQNEENPGWTWAKFKNFFRGK